MAADCAHELRKFNVAYVSLWPCAVMTETIEQFVETEGGKSMVSTLYSSIFICKKHFISYLYLMI